MPASKQQDISLETINQTIYKHLEERDWHNSPSRDLAISLSLEANELLEHYQWGETPTGGAEAVGDELADVFIYGMQIAQENSIDIMHHIERKLEKASKKYPAQDFKGKDALQQTEVRIKKKLAYKKSGL
jgi:NTP pyrophosphatase (non-canonical NTP hydrolase)